MEHNEETIWLDGTDGGTFEVLTFRVAGRAWHKIVAGSPSRPYAATHSIRRLNIIRCSLYRPFNCASRDCWRSR